jgi:hypothetical protein
MMACDRAEDRTLLLSLGLFGAPAAGETERDREALVAEARDQAGPDPAKRDS